MENRLVPYQASTSLGKGRALVLAPHPDDEVFGCGGTIALQVAQGNSIQVIVLTNGDYQSTPMDAIAYGARRQEESRKAADILGYGEPVFWGLKDRGVEYGEELVQRITSAINDFMPQRVLAPSIYEMHPDHRATGMAALEAVRRQHSSLELVMYEVGVPMLRPNRLLDISDLSEQKNRAMACFASQLVGQAYDRQINALNCFRTYTLGPNVTAAEAFLVVQPFELSDHSLELYQSEHQRQRALGLPMLPQDIPLVSIVLVHQGNLSWRTTMDSIALQTYSHIEILMPGPSGNEDDPGQGQCGRFPLRYIAIDPEAESWLANNTAMAHAKGEYLLLLEACDLLLPNHIAKLVHAIKEHEVLVAYTGIEITGANGEKCGVLDEVWTVDRLRGENFLSTCAVLFSRKLIEKGCRFKENASELGCWDYWIQLSEHTDFLHIGEVSAIHRQSPSQTQSENDSTCGFSHSSSVPEEWIGRFAPSQWSATLMWFSTERERLQRNASAARSEMQQMRIEHRAQRDKLSDTQQALSRTQSDLSEAKAHLSRAIEENARMKESLAAQSDHAYALQEAVQAFASSASWKLTFPLRLVSRLLRGKQRSDRNEH